MPRRQKHCFRLDRLTTPIGVALVVQDEHGRLRALDWEDHEERMTRLLRLHYGDDGVELVEGDGSGPIAGRCGPTSPGRCRRLMPCRSRPAGPHSSAGSGASSGASEPGTTLSYRQLARRIGSSRTPSGRSGSPTARIPSASSCRATGSSAPTAASRATPAGSRASAGCSRTRAIATASLPDEPAR